MIKSKVLNQSAWKDVLAKNKTVKDNGLLKVLAEIAKLEDDDHEEAQAVLGEVQKLVAQLKKAKEVAAAPAVAKFLTELSGAADTAQRDVAKAKAEADKAAKAEAAAEKKAEAAKKGGDDEEEEFEDSPELLTSKLKPLLKLVAKGERMHALVAKSGKNVVVMLSRKPIPPARRKMLAEELGGGTTKYYPGHCHLEAGAVTFVLKAEVAGLAKLIKAALLIQTGKRLTKVKCRGEDGDDDDGDDEEGGALAGMGQDADDEDDEGDAGGQVAAAAPGAPGAQGSPGANNEGPKAKSEVPAFVPGVEVAAGLAQLAKTPQVWDGTRQLLQSKIEALKKAVQVQLGDEADDYIKGVNDQLQKLDRITGRLDKRLGDALGAAAQATDPAQRQKALDESKTTLTEYVQYIKSEPLIGHLDNNPFGVQMELMATMTKSLKALGGALTTTIANHR
jgi:hypothetical protein